MAPVMRSPGLFVSMALVLLCALMAGCGGSKRLSASEYRARLAALGKEADKAFVRRNPGVTFVGCGFALGGGCLVLRQGSDAARARRDAHIL